MPLFLESLPAISEHLFYFMRGAKKIEIHEKKTGYSFVEYFEGKPCIWMVETIGRITTPFVILIEVLSAGIFQMMRALNALIGGILDFDVKKIVLAIQDVASVAAQAILLPLLLFVSIISPSLVLYTCVYLQACFEPSKEDKPFWAYPYAMKYKHDCAARVMSVISSLLLTIPLVINGALETVKFVGCEGRFDCAALSFVNTIFALGVFFKGLHGICNRDVRVKITEKNWSSKVFTYKKTDNITAEKPNFSFGSVSYYVAV